MNCTRRDFLRVGSGSVLAALFSGKLQPLFAQDKVARAKACIFLFMYGAPSHIDTWDPKPGSKYGGEFKPIRTDAGFQVSEHLPKLAKRSKKLAVIRSMTSPEVDHGRGAYYMRTGFRPTESVEHPAIGAVFAKELAKDDADVPAFVSIMPAFDAGLMTTSGYLGEGVAPFIIDTPGEVPGTLARPDIVTDERLERRLRLLEEYERRHGEERMEEASKTARELRRKASRYMKGPLARALDLTKESDAARESYGTNDDGYLQFGQGCLVARRLVECGVKFVEVTMQGWDTHEDNFNVTRGLCAETDAGFSALLTDLESRRLLDSTLIIWGGEFGRTPEINEQAGRDHHGDVFSCVVAGGGVKGGQVVGASDADGAQVKERPVNFPDLMATVSTLAGIDPEKEYYTPEGRPIKVVEGGKPVKELL